MEKEIPPPAIGHDVFTDSQFPPAAGERWVKVRFVDASGKDRDVILKALPAAGPPAWPDANATSIAYSFGARLKVAANYHLYLGFVGRVPAKYKIRVGDDP